MDVGEDNSKPVIDTDPYFKKSILVVFREKDGRYASLLEQERQISENLQEIKSEMAKIAQQESAKFLIKHIIYLTYCISQEILRTQLKKRNQEISKAANLIYASLPPISMNIDFKHMRAEISKANAFYSAGERNFKKKPGQDLFCINLLPEEYLK